MSLCHLSSFSYTTHNLRPFISFPQLLPPSLRWSSHQNPYRRNPILACSAEKFSKKWKASRRSKSNEELCDELREFISSTGLLADHVPSMKELAEHGRKDLANVVRRRGCRVIAELLKMPSGKGPKVERNSLGNQENSSGCRDEASEDQERNPNEPAECISLSDGHSLVENCIVKANDSVLTDTVPTSEPSESSSSLHLKATSFHEDQERNPNDPAECVSLSDGLSLVENCIVKANGSVLTDTVRTSEPSESSSSLHLKATRFINTGILDTIEDACDPNKDMPTEAEYDFHISNFNGSDRVSVPAEQVPPYSVEQHQDRDNAAPCEELETFNFNVDLASDMVEERNNQIEIDQLKTMLHKKEMELSMLKQQIEKDKEALSVLQATMNMEIDNAHRNISAKDMELLNAERSLSGLKEIQIEYWANGETVEVAGSFNGWHHQVKMDLHSSTSTISSSGSRKSKLWSTVLWLYPGMYEIKFIVDGHWKIDSQREIVTIGNITNNVLRVDR